jgi:hypothetical protein
MRVQSLDNLKVVLIAAIIAIHGVLGYAGFDEWCSYADVQETVLQPETGDYPYGPRGTVRAVHDCLLFLMAGLLAAPSLQPNGIRGFVHARLLRLGLPFLAFFSSRRLLPDGDRGHWRCGRFFRTGVAPDSKSAAACPRALISGVGRQSQISKSYGV